MLGLLRKLSGGGDIGLVLSGGGAKGAYQAGVWKALCESGVAERVKAISGTSIGAINAAAFAAVRDPARIEEFWLKRVHGAVVSRPGGLFSEKTLKRWLNGALDGFASGRGFPFPGVLDRAGLERSLRDLLPDAWPPNGPAVYATTLESSGGPWPAGELRKRVFRVDAESDPVRRREILLASAAIPFGLDPVEMDGASFVDGGWDAMGGDNVPAEPILENHAGIRTLVVVHLNAVSLEDAPWRRPTRRPALLGGVRYIEIRPSEPLPSPFDEAAKSMEHFVTDGLAEKAAPFARFLRKAGGVLAFDRDSAARSIALGHADAIKALGRFPTCQAPT